MFNWWGHCLKLWFLGGFNSEGFWLHLGLTWILPLDMAPHSSFEQCSNPLVLQFIEVFALDILPISSHLKHVGFLERNGLIMLNICEWYIMICVLFLVQCFWKDILIDPYDRHVFLIFFSKDSETRKHFFSATYRRPSHRSTLPNSILPISIRLRWVKGPYKVGPYQLWGIITPLIRVITPVALQDS